MRTGQEKEERGTEEEDEKRKGKEKVEEGRKERSALRQCRVVKERAPRWLTFWSDALKTKLAALTFPSLPPIRSEKTNPCQLQKVGGGRGRESLTFLRIFHSRQHSKGSIL